MGIVNARQQTTFANPQNAQSPIDANVVRSNDNTLRTTYNGHDADPTIHLQNGLVATRPVASTAGQMWLATDTGAVYLYLDTGSAWLEINYLRSTGGTVTGATTFSAGLTVSSGTTALQAATVTTLAATGAMSTTAVNAAIFSAGASTTARYAQLANTSGSILVGTEGTPGAQLVAGTSAYDAFIRAHAALAFSLDDGVTLHGRWIASALTINTQVVVSTGGINVIGNSSIAGTLTGLTGLTVASGGATITAGGLTVSAGTTAVQALTATTGAFTGLLSTGTPSAAGSGFRLTQGVAPTTPTNGDLWFDGASVKVQIGGVTRTFTVT